MSRFPRLVSRCAGESAAAYSARAGLVLASWAGCGDIRPFLDGFGLFVGGACVSYVAWPG